jgi:hypothetical protein
LQEAAQIAAIDDAKIKITAFGRFTASIRPEY